MRSSHLESWVKRSETRACLCQAGIERQDERLDRHGAARQNEKLQGCRPFEIFELR
jgi:hypothetical protein